jgi:hypothetical protein
MEDEVATHIANYEALGVRYLLTPRKPMIAALAAIGMKLIVKDAQSELFELPQSANFYSTALSSCTLTGPTVDSVDVNCPTSTTLTRLELSMPGWTALVNGAPSAITSTDGLTQTVTVPAGNSVVTYNFLPPHEDLALAGGALSLMILIIGALPWRRRRRGDEDTEARRHDAPEEGDDDLGGPTLAQPDAQDQLEVVSVVTTSHQQD